jgi:cAMP-binding proteins - catabolite gene activator and regulatory subunit of cAMP-dependent protein kinases
MPRRDFFSFCTTLRPVELKALGELSRVRHLQKDEMIYQSGDISDAIYSVNRGVVELTYVTPKSGDERTYLSRGDIFGLTETLAGLERSHSACAQELVSVQCFEAQNFTAIARRVPTFFLFLCEQMALRLQQSSAIAATSVCQQLRGDLANFDLVTVHQTIISSGQTGELCVLNESGERIATFFFENGSPRSGQFQHLTGEEAFWQLFLCENIPGTFSFSAGARPITDCLQSAEIQQSPHDLLLSAMQYRDELAELKKSMPTPRTLLQRFANDFEWPNDVDERLRPLAERVWRLIDHRRVTIDQLFRQNSVCELKIYTLIAEMLRTGQIAIVDETAHLAKAS